VAVVQVGAWCVGLKSLGKATPGRRMAASFSRRSAISWFSSAATVMGGVGTGEVIGQLVETAAILGAAGRGAALQSPAFLAGAARCLHRSPSSTALIRFALVGCGRISANHIEALRQHAGRAELVAVCDNRPEALAAAVAKTGAQGFASLDAPCWPAATPTSWCWPRPAACTRARPCAPPRPAAMC
jgi:hypothetical protein